MNRSVFSFESDDIWLVAQSLCILFPIPEGNLSTLITFLRKVRTRKPDAETSARAIVQDDPEIIFNRVSGEYFFCLSNDVYISLNLSDVSIFSWVVTLSVFGKETSVPRCITAYKILRTNGYTASSGMRTFKKQMA